MARRGAGAASVPLFSPPDRLRPLADRMRPRTLDEVVGQDALLGPGAALRRLVEGGRLPSCILWGPPGSGKTTIGRLLAEAVGARFAALNSTTDGVATLRSVVEDARSAAALEGRTTVVFLDEVHRYSKAQQDALLPHVEAGTIVLVGATTEPPIAGGITPPLLSRLRVFRLQPLGESELATIAERALVDPDQGLAGAYALDESAARQLVGYASGDARRLLGLLETAAALADRRMVDAATDDDSGGEPAPARGPALIEPADVARAAQSPILGYDRSGVISALIKSIRGSDPDAAVWWLATALESGEDPRYVARRLVISASEDVGNAEPAALPLAVAALGAVEKIGAETNDEGLYALAQAAIFLAASPKSAAAGRAYFAARDELRAAGPRPVPGHLRPAARTYRNPHDATDAAIDQAYLPRALAGRRFWEPTEAGAEARLRELHLARRAAKSPPRAPAREVAARRPRRGEVPRACPRRPTRSGSGLQLEQPLPATAARRQHGERAAIEGGDPVDAESPRSGDEERVGQLRTMLGVLHQQRGRLDQVGFRGRDDSDRAAGQGVDQGQRRRRAQLPLEDVIYFGKGQRAQQERLVDVGEPRPSGGVIEVRRVGRGEDRRHVQQHGHASAAAVGAPPRPGLATHDPARIQREAPVRCSGRCR